MAEDYSFTHRYIPVPDVRNRNLFKEEYYSGSDVTIKFDGMEQTEIAAIGYSIQEQLLPIYGYASRTYDTIAIGNRIVNGTFRVSIKNPEPQTALADVETRMSEWNENLYANSNDDYNRAERESLANNEWTGDRTGDSTYSDDQSASDTEKDPEQAEYEQKAKIFVESYTEGYVYHYNKDGEWLDWDFGDSSQVKEIQKLFILCGQNIEVTGVLDAPTKELLDRFMAGEISLSDEP